ncbi:TPA: hypothetical protein EYG96_01920 [Candidatus Gracilibacteria bacterium]|nr:hypothetical protein [Candidatus Peregrinibacteria bacterium]HIQ56780.1 hypothetical protein [Candidatus Gracilibacteria bacterium]
MALFEKYQHYFWIIAILLLMYFFGGYKKTPIDTDSYCKGEYVYEYGRHGEVIDTYCDGISPEYQDYLKYGEPDFEIYIPDFPEPNY